jgi:dipeptidyl-peptidase-4
MTRVSLFVLFLLTTHLHAQGTQADYARSKSLAETYTGKVLNTRPTVTWQADGSAAYYRQQRPGNTSHFYKIDLKTGTKNDAFDHAKLAAELSKVLKKNVEATKLPFTNIEPSHNGKLLIFTAEGGRYQFNTADNTVEKFSGITAETPPQRNNRFPNVLGRRVASSADGLWRLSIKDQNVVLINRKTEAEEKLTKEGTAAEPFVEQFYWSPNSKYAILLRVKPAQEHKVSYIESSPASQVQPKLSDMQYLKPGDEVAKPTLFLFDVTTKKVTKLDNKLFPNPYQLTQYTWDSDSSRFTFLYNQRGHQVLRVIAVDPTTSAVSAAINEESKTFVEYSGKFYFKRIDGTSDAIWMSERNGWNHLYLMDLAKGQVKKQLTSGNWVVRRVIKADDKQKVLWFTCGGCYAEQDPYQLHLGRVNYDGTGLKILTTTDAHHATELSPTGEFFVDISSRVDLTPITEVRSAVDGKLLVTLEKCDLKPLEAVGWKPPQRFVAPGRDGTTPIYGIIFRPSNFDPSKKYPVIEQIYAGPQDAFVPKDFRPYYRLQSLVELGFIVVQIDGMGTSQRSKAFHDVCWKNLGDAGFPDRIAWMKAAAQKHPEMDLSRVGLYGGSAGGQNALRGLLMHGDFYKVGAADCGCHDNRMDKIWWNELWMSWPIGPHYAEQSNVTQAHRLQGKLLLTVGELDKNVDPASTMQVVNALIKANKDFDFIIVPGAGHGIGESPYMNRRRQDFFVRHLLGTEPRK